MQITNIITTYSLRAAWVLLTFGAFFLFYNVTVEHPYFSFRTDIGFWLAKRDMVGQWAWTTAFYTHIIGSIFCVVIGPFQFVPSLRRRFGRWHRSLGKVYVFTILGIGAPSGMYMAWYANGGFWAQLGFTILASLWIITTYYAYRTACLHQWKAHQRLMVWSYALTFSAVTLRTWMPLLTMGYFGVFIPQETAVVLTAWINWIPNVIIGEILLYFFAKRI